MKIILSVPVAIKLLAYAAATRMEYSGFGFCRRENNGDINVYDFVLLDVGNEGYTEINPAKILPLMEREDRANMKVWCHKHPVQNWSSRDLQTILKEPLGSTPEAVGWSVSIVLTPVGWIGRIDNYVKGISKDLEVEPNISEAYQAIRELEKARAPFRHFRAAELEEDETDYGDFDEDELEEWEEDEEVYPYQQRKYPILRSSPNDAGPVQRNPLDRGTVGGVLEFLAGYHGDPASTSLAEVLEDYGVNWQEIREKARLS